MGENFGRRIPPKVTRGSPTTLCTEDCIFVSNSVGGGGISDCGDYAHQTNGETKKLVYDIKGRIGKANAYKEARDIVLGAWQHEWDRNKKGRWTRRLIGQIRPWIEREHGEANYYMTLFLTGHWFFLAYFFKIGKVRSSACVYCGAIFDDAEHTFFACNRWSDKRTELEHRVRCLTPDIIVSMVITKRIGKHAQTSQRKYCKKKKPMNTL